MTSEDALAIVRKVAARVASIDTKGDQDRLEADIKDLPAFRSILEDFVPVLSNEAVADADLLDLLVDVGRPSAQFLQEITREGFDPEGVDFDADEMARRYTQISGLHKSAAFSTEQDSAIKAAHSLLAVVKTLVNNYERGSKKLQSRIDSFESGSPDRATAEGTYKYFLTSYDRFLNGPVDLKALHARISKFMKERQGASHASEVLHDIQELRSKVLSVFSEAASAVAADPSLGAAVSSIGEGAWSRAKSVLLSIGLSTSGKAMSQQELVKQAMRKTAELGIDAFRDEMLSVLASARETVREGKGDLGSLQTTLTQQYTRVLSDVGNVLVKEHTAKNFQKEEGVDMRLADTLESLLGEGGRLPIVFNTFQARSQALGPREEKNLASKASKWRANLETRLKAHGLRPDGTVTSDLIEKSAFVDDSSVRSLGTGKKVQLGSDLKGILSDIAAYWKAYVTLVKSGRDHAGAAAGFVEALTGTEPMCLGRGVHSYAKYLMGLVEAKASPGFSGSLRGAAMALDGTVSGRIVNTVKASPHMHETWMGAAEDKSKRSARKIMDIMDSGTRDALEDLDETADSLPAELTSPLPDEPETNLVDRFLGDHPKEMSDIVDTITSHGMRGEIADTRGRLNGLLSSLKAQFSEENFRKYRKQVELEAEKAQATSRVQADSLTQKMLDRVHSAMSSLVSGGNSMEPSIPPAGDTPGSEVLRAVLSGLDSRLEAVLHSGELTAAYGEAEPPRADEVVALGRTLDALEAMYSGAKLKGGATAARLPNLHNLLEKLYEPTAGGSYRLRLFPGIEASPIHKVEKKPATKETVEPDVVVRRTDLFNKMKVVLGHLASGDLSLSGRVPEASEVRSALRGLLASMINMGAGDAALSLGDMTPEQAERAEASALRALDELRSLYAGGRAHSDEDTRLKLPRIVELLEGHVYRKEGGHYHLLPFPAVSATPAVDTGKADQTEAKPAESLPDEVKTEVSEAAEGGEKATEGKKVFTQAIDLTHKRIRAVQDSMARNRDKAQALRYHAQMAGLAEQVETYRAQLSKYDEALAAVETLSAKVSELQSGKGLVDMEGVLGEVRKLSDRVDVLTKALPKNPVLKVEEVRQETTPAKEEDPALVAKAAKILSSLSTQFTRASQKAEGGEGISSAKLSGLARVTKGAADSVRRHSSLPWEWVRGEERSAQEALSALESASDEGLLAAIGEQMNALFHVSNEGSLKLKVYPLVVSSGDQPLLKVLQDASIEEPLALPAEESAAEPPGDDASRLEALRGGVSKVLNDYLHKANPPQDRKADVESLIKHISTAKSLLVGGNALENLLRLPEVFGSGKVPLASLYNELAASPTKSGSKKVGIGKYLRDPGKMFLIEDEAPTQRPAGKEKAEPAKAPAEPATEVASGLAKLRSSLDSTDRGTLGRYLKSEEAERPGSGDYVSDLVRNFIGAVEAQPAGYAPVLEAVLGLLEERRYDAIADEIQGRRMPKSAGSAGEAMSEITVKLSWHFFGQGTGRPRRVLTDSRGMGAFRARVKNEESEDFKALDEAFKSILKTELATAGSVPFLSKSADTHSGLFSMLKSYRTQKGMTRPEFLLSVLDLKTAPASQLDRLYAKEKWESGSPRKDTPPGPVGPGQLDLFK